MMLIILILIILLYLFLIKPNSKRDTSYLDDYLYTHRGLFDNKSIAENSLSAFKEGVLSGHGTELDVHLTKDNQLVVIHDSKTYRVTGKEGIVEEMTYDELSNLKLVNTDDTIPLFEEVIKIYEGKAPIIIEIKTYKNNVNDIMPKVIALTDRHPELLCCYESFDPSVLIWLKENRPELIRGQLSYDYFNDPNSKLNVIVKFVLTNLLLNFKTKPDFIAYDVRVKFNFSKYLTKELFKTKQVAWTVKDQKMFDKKKEEGLVIFEGFKSKID